MVRSTSEREQCHLSGRQSGARTVGKNDQAGFDYGSSSIWTALLPGWGSAVTRPLTASPSLDRLPLERKVAENLACGLCGVREEIKSVEPDFRWINPTSGCAGWNCNIRVQVRSANPGTPSLLYEASELRHDPLPSPGTRSFRGLSPGENDNAAGTRKLVKRLEGSQRHRIDRGHDYGVIARGSDGQRFPVDLSESAGTLSSKKSNP